MTEQIPLFLEDYNEAIRQTVLAVGGFKKVGSQIRPELPADQAGRWLSDCCNPERRDILDPARLGLLRRISRAAGVHILMAYEAMDAGYAEPHPIEPEDEAAELERQFITAAEKLAPMLERIELLRTTTKKRA